MPNLETERAKEDIRVGSKSFSLASLAFGQRQREAAWHLYAWCRYADDQVDQVSSPDEGRERLLAMREKLAETEAGVEQMEYPWPVFQRLLQEFGIPVQYPRDLLEGFARDTAQLRIENEKELKIYCYAVAGTVGLMMSHIMGVSDRAALRHAEALGRAMQLTNIARDVREDWERGRVYIPRTLLAGEPFSDLRNTKVAVDYLLYQAEKLYEQGLEGLQFLPFRAALAVCAALFIYREIGRRILAGSPEILLQRVVVSKPRKVFLFLKAIGFLCMHFPQRVFNPWKPVGELPLWRPN